MDKHSNLSGHLSEKLIKVDERRDSRQNGRKSSLDHRASKISRGGDSDSLQLIEDVFGLYYDEQGKCHSIKRFTWKNRNKIQVQVINYGARIVSIKLPDRKGEIEDIVLGFDDLAGYIYYKKNYFGATLGRMSNVVKNSTFVIDNKQYWLNPNQLPHHVNGGKMGLDQAVWTTYVDDKKVIMSHVSPHLSEGYPGDLFIRVSFELSVRNEFNIEMEAQCTQPTIVNLSNLTYFNLGGHYQGPDHLYRHIVTLNCNCFTPQVHNLPSGEIVNVVHTEFDFQIPKMLGKVMGIIPKDGYNQNLCINRGLHQDDCLVARVLHPPSGRMLEIYSNQWGVNFSTANEFGYGRVISMEELLPEGSIHRDSTLVLFEKVHKELVDHLTIDEKQNYVEMRDLIKKIRGKCKKVDAPANTPESSLLDEPTALPVESTPAVEVIAPEVVASEEETPEEEESKLTLTDVFFTPFQIEYLRKILKIICDEYEEEECMQLKKVITNILEIAVLQEVITHKEEEETRVKIPGEKSIESIPAKKPKKSKPENAIPFCYRKTNQIIGKERAPYRMHGGIALQTQNYPCCANFKNFPSCVLRPGETYKHTITYKFWIRAGNPNKWIKRNLNQNKPNC